jgi:UDP-GlcNAc:undecaprenyl-phosphate/decaprenyl-phosphate GlcNAc-1-phosphate transferase
MMSAGNLAAALTGAVIGGCAAWATARLRLRAPPPRLVRTNVSGRAVPAVLGDALTAGGLVGLAGLLLGDRAASAGRMAGAVSVVLAVMWVGGRADDLRGDEGDRGFRGHLRAAAGGRVTGGLVKIAAGGAAGVAAGLLMTGGWDVVLVAATVALAANLFNLLDRAPGRAGKLWLIVVAPVAALGTEVWTVAAAGTIGALLVVLPLDLGARAMLGDAGANPLGAVWGLGVAAAMPVWATAIAVGVLLVLNAASERWSFSVVIEKTPGLRALDRLGRK